MDVLLFVERICKKEYHNYKTQKCHRFFTNFINIFFYLINHLQFNALVQVETNLKLAEKFSFFILLISGKTSNYFLYSKLSQKTKQKNVAGLSRKLS